MKQPTYLEHLIPREDFDSNGDPAASSDMLQTLTISHLKKTEFFLSLLKKPSFQRDTNNWSHEKVIEFVESFVNGELIPSLILWKNSINNNIFIIDGSHRLSALIAWINDDYGDGDLSKKHYAGDIDQEVIASARAIRTKINTTIGSYLSYTDIDNLTPEKQMKASSIAARGLNLQWVQGNSSKAEESFFKINQQGVSISIEEIDLIKNRYKPSGIAARAILSYGGGQLLQNSNLSIDDIELSKKIFNMLFTPRFDSKNNLFPIGGPLSDEFTLNKVYTIISMISSEDRNLQVSQILRKLYRVLSFINSDEQYSLGLNQLVYFYGTTLKHKVNSLFGIVSLFIEIHDNSIALNKFINCRESFESFIVNNEFIVQTISRRRRQAKNAYLDIKEYYKLLIDLCSQSLAEDEIFTKLQDVELFSYLAKENAKPTLRKNKNLVKYKTKIESIPKCKICKGYIDERHISIDHIDRKADGGSDDLNNLQISHLYCNTTYKN